MRLKIKEIQKNRWFKFFASVRFAIPVLFTFAAAMTVGTVLESLHGASYASRVVYHSWWFHLIQYCIAQSVLLAMVARFPYQKRLTGFYIVHISLLTVLSGSVITYFWGVDGTIELQEGASSDQVRLSDDLAYFIDGKVKRTYPLPKVVSETTLDETLTLAGAVQVHLLRYLPYAKESSVWVPAAGIWSSSWMLKNSRFGQQVDLVDAPGAASSMDLGKLHLEVVSSELYAALEGATATVGLVLMDAGTGKSYVLPASLEKHRLPGTPYRISKVFNPKIQMEFFSLETPTGALRFFPRFSTKPVTSHLDVQQDSPFTLFDLSRFSVGNNVLVSRAKDGPIRIAIGAKGRWAFKTYQGEPIALPWMGFTFSLEEDHPNSRPQPSYVQAVANKDEEKNMKALLVEVERGTQSEELWLTNRGSTRSTLGFEEAFIGVQQVHLPFQMSLERFKMDVVPGTADRPASYESFVKVAGRGPGEETVHIHMNNPYKADGYTFYQASYLQGEDGRYHSILSVNRDSGRPVKYVGALTLVLGLVLYFLTIYGVIKW